MNFNLKSRLEELGHTDLNENFICTDGNMVVCGEIPEESKKREKDFNLPSKMTWQLDTKNCAETALNTDWGNLLTIILMPKGSLAKIKHTYKHDS